jgi:hypothetical protein
MPLVTAENAALHVAALLLNAGSELCQPVRFPLPRAGRSTHFQHCVEFVGVIDQRYIHDRLIALDVVDENGSPGRVRSLEVHRMQCELRIASLECRPLCRVVPTALLDQNVDVRPAVGQVRTLLIFDDHSINAHRIEPAERDLPDGGFEILSLKKGVSC